MNLGNIGEKIRLLREKKGISRETVCEDERDLTYKQLGRIERGESRPTLETLAFIAQQLDVDIADLLSEKKELPKRYLELKNLLFRGIKVYQNEERAETVDEQFDEIYNNYFEDLPRYEQDTIELKQILHDMTLTKTAGSAEEIIAESFDRVYKKDDLDLNDFLIIKLYFNLSILKNEVDTEEVKTLSQKVIEKIESAIDLELLVIGSILTSIAIILIEKKNYEELLKIIEIGEKLRKKTLDFRSKPVFCMLKGKCILFHQKDPELAKQHYQEAITSAEMLEDSFLSEKIKEELRNDLIEYNALFS
ncbi:Helix-turn-helix domain-containing protein [Pilibacter termitis]|uniref:Helix-turn-helix domain-containing protein n=1 Tax=Pilibacter termitis TaxID=263852 RepID=A0A1T4MJM7_9ENTE|nr:XRE family transcriptional regulator [Pilibacter termitis]SJZ66958.1 Helix-turn-helix domain-containing protein [Pilibacter termitis]